MWHLESLTRPARRAVFVLLTFFCASVAQAEASYYLLIFGSQSEPKCPRLTHASRTKQPGLSKPSRHDCHSSWIALQTCHSASDVLRLYAQDR
jgi:hypothetical protein